MRQEGHVTWLGKIIDNIFVVTHKKKHFDDLDIGCEGLDQVQL